MYFQTLDNKNECIGVYFDGRLQDGDLPEDFNKTWSYASYLDDVDDKRILYANLLCGGKTLEDACPSTLLERWQEVSSRLKSYFRAFNEAKVDLNENCFFDLVPKRFLLDFCEMKNKITEHVFENYEIHENYDFLLDLTRVIESIRSKKLNIEVSALKNKLHEFKARQWREKIKNCSPYISYDILGTKTGRLTTKKMSFPMLTFPKEYRSVLKPTNDWFIELDFNAAELRTLLALSEQDQPKEDIHEWNAKNVYRDSTTREEAKKRIFAWLYNPNSKDRLSDKIYDRERVKNKYYSDGLVTTMFDRKIESDEHHALNYIIQSTTSDLFLRRMIKVHEVFKDKKSFIAFCMHDSLVLDITNDEKKEILKIKEIFSNTDLGKFKVNLTAGQSYGNMRELKI